MSEEVIRVPDIGGEGEVTEICVSVGDNLEKEDSLVVLESDKASMEVPVPVAGKVTAILIKEGDHLKEGDELVRLDVAASQSDSRQETINTDIEKTEEYKASPAKETSDNSSPASRIVNVCVPDIGAENVPVIEVAVKEGDEISKEDGLVTLESDKASMEVPSPYDGKVVAVKVREGDTLSNGDLILEMEVTDSAGLPPSRQQTPEKSIETIPSSTGQTPANTASQPSMSGKPGDKSGKTVHAGPAVRRLAREFGVTLEQVTGTGPKGRVVKEDVQQFVKERLQASPSGSASVSGIPQIPAVDFGAWGDVEEKPLGRLKTVAARNFQRSWLNVPHVTQFDEADITGLEEFRQAQKKKALDRGIRLTPLPFLLKACGYALEEMPQFCASLNSGGDKIIYKKYINIGVAVDTPEGLLVPVIRDVNKKGLYDLAVECVELAAKAKNKQLKPDEMKGGCFTISSLGSIGGTAFTPIVNAPEVAILGVSKASQKPFWNGNAFVPRLMLPLSLSYDHRAINGADAARFTSLLHELLSDIRRLLL